MKCVSQFLASVSGCFLAIVLLASVPVGVLAQGSSADYERAADLGKRFTGKVFRDRVEDEEDRVRRAQHVRRGRGIRRIRNE